MPVSRNRKKPHFSRSPKNKDIEIELCSYANDAKDRDELMEVLKLFYRGAVKSQVGIAMAQNDEGEEEVILVGIERTLHGTEHIYPIAKVLGAMDLQKYKIPDGKGGYVEVA